MLSKIKTATVYGINALPVIVETDISRGLPGLNIVGMADQIVKESKERIRAAISNSGLDYPMNRITINMAPADIRKKGSHFDLPITMGILSSGSLIYGEKIDKYGFIGELSLDGGLVKTKGILPMVMALKEEGVKNVIIPFSNRKEAALVSGIHIYPAEYLSQVIDHFNLVSLISEYEGEGILEREEDYGNLDFADVKGQEFAKRAITVAVSGGHGILMSGSPSTGKTMLSERIPTVMPEMTFDEIVETTMIYSVAGLLDEEHPLVLRRPFRRPHHKITVAGLMGGGNYPQPGEITLANKGVLFLDELGEFDRNLLEVLRLPLEEKKVSLMRRGKNFVYPADFLLVAATNPCKCGYLGDPTHECKCTMREIETYTSKLSGPIMDRIDMSIKLGQVNYEELKSEKGESSKDIREQIQNARNIQMERFKSENITLNNQMNEYLLKKYGLFTSESEEFLEKAYKVMDLNPRTLNKVKRVARTIADLEESENVLREHVGEALQYRDFKKEGDII